MRALMARQFGRYDMLELAELPVPRPQAGQVAIRVAAAAINFPDLLVIAGKYQVRPPLPFIPGKELAGEIVAVGPGVEGLDVGDRVIALLEYGAFAEIVVAPADACFRVPDAIVLHDAAAIGIAYQTAHFALHHRGGLRKGERVLVSGASGSVGSAAIQLAKAAGASVIGVVNRAHRTETALAAGCDAVVTFAEGDDPNAFREEVRRLGGGDIDLLVENVGGNTFTACLRCIAWEGRAIVVGFTSGSIPEIRANYLLVKNIGVLGLQWSDYRDRDPDLVRKAQTEIFSDFQSGAMKILPIEIFPVARHLEAFEALESRAASGKLVLDFGSADG